jgi:hypothetical protein
MLFTSIQDQRLLYVLYLKLPLPDDPIRSWALGRSSELEIARPLFLTGGGAIAGVLWLDKRGSRPVNNLRLSPPLGFRDDLVESGSALQALRFIAHFGTRYVVKDDGLKLIVCEERPKLWPVVFVGHTPFIVS